MPSMKNKKSENEDSFSSKKFASKNKYITEIHFLTFYTRFQNYSVYASRACSHEPGWLALPGQVVICFT
jgi:hypothetical protein